MDKEASRVKTLERELAYVSAGFDHLLEEYVKLEKETHYNRCEAKMEEEANHV